METQFRVGEVFARSLTILFANILPFATIAAIVTIPASALDIYDSYLLDTQGTTIPWLGPMDRLLSFVLGPIATGAITFGVIQQLREQHVSFGRCLSVGLSRLLPVLVVAFLVGIVTGIGFILLIVPGLWFMCRLWVAIPVAVVERAGVIGAMNRSDQLTKGSRWRILGLAMLILVIQFGAGAVIGAVAMVALDSFVALSILTLPIVIFATAWQASAQAVSYYTLRSMKEMVNVDQIAAVFD